MEGGSGGAEQDTANGADVHSRPFDAEPGATSKDELKSSNGIKTPVDAGEISGGSLDMSTHMISSVDVDSAQSSKTMVVDVQSDLGTNHNNEEDSGDVKFQNIKIDPALFKQLPDLEMKLEETRDNGTNTMDTAGSSSETAASLITLAGGAINQYLSASWAQGIDPASPEISSKNLTTPLPSMIGPGSPTSRDGKHTTLPPLNSIDVLAELATKQESPQQQQAQPSNLPPPTTGSPGYVDGTTRPPLQHMSVQQRQLFMGLETNTGTGYYPHHQPHYPPIKDTTTGSPQPTFQGLSPQPTYQALNALSQTTTPDSANLFARGFSSQTSGAGARRESSSTEFQYSSDQATPQGPSTGETLPSSGPDEPVITTSRNHRSQTGPLSGGGFKCEFEGCKAPPFQTQYLLNSHANVHSSARPHYCPVKDCPRGEGGKGFKRKNEMIRHGLVHDSPGYICPFCPDREHKYPRPDNLQRHVRVHHLDKDKDDPLLRDVLSQRPEGGTRGRRRRVGA